MLGLPTRAAGRLSITVLMLGLIACAGPGAEPPPASRRPPPTSEVGDDGEAERRLGEFARVELENNLALLTPNQRRVLALLVEAAEKMDAIFWRQAYGERETLMLALTDPAQRELVRLNYGPWDRFDGDRPFIAGVGPKPAGANFYPIDMGREEFSAAELPDKARPDTLLRRTPSGSLMTLPYVDAYREELEQAARLLGRAAQLSDDPALRRFLTLKARALITGDFHPSDRFWMKMPDTAVDLIMGPIHRREDRLFGYKGAYTAWVLVRDRAWAHQFADILDLLPDLQRRLPVAPLYRADEPSVAVDVAAFEVVFHAGLANAGPKAAAINVPVRGAALEWRSRKLYLRNVMAPQFDRLIRPVAEALIAEDQRHHVTFDAFFANTVLKDISRGLGPRKTVNSGVPVEQALERHHVAIEEGKAEILALLVLRWLREAGRLTDADRRDYYVTYVADTLRKVRAGGRADGAVADIIRFNYLRAFDGVTRDPESGTYRVHPDRVHEAARALAAQMLILQGNGDMTGFEALVADMGRISEKLRDDLQRLTTLNVPVGLIFEHDPSNLAAP